MVTTLLLLSALAGFFGAAEGQDFHFGKCPSPPVQKDFDLQKYLGKWYEIEKIEISFEKGSCAQVNYFQTEEGNIKATNQIQRPDGSVHQTESELITARLAEPAKMTVQYYPQMHPFPYWVLTTNYDSYALVYSCFPLLSVAHKDYAWILGRNSSLPEETRDYLKSILSSNNIRTDKMTETDQSNCIKPI